MQRLDGLLRTLQIVGRERLTKSQIRTDKAVQLLGHFWRSIHVRHRWHLHFIVRHRQRELRLHLIDVLASQREHTIGFTHGIHFATFGDVVPQ